MRILLFLLFIPILAQAQDTYWQQEANYTMNIDFDVESNQYTGEQSIEYTNNSPDTLFKAYYHLYFNAFQPGSMMDVRSRNISDPDGRVQDRISKLKPEEIGYLHAKSLLQDGKAASFKEEGSILIVELPTPILPGEKAVLAMTFEGQVPLQIRRSGRDNKEGIRYSMSQWYPKLSEYDYMGWHPNPYIGREFYGIWGDFDVKISIDPSYVVGGTGYLQNGNEVGYGYEDEGVKVKRPRKEKLTWHFKAPNVHDFMWAADPDYKHVMAQVPDGPTLHFYYQEGDETRDWELLPEKTVQAFQFMNKNFGKYPYDQFSVIQGGDGGMEYPMSTLITGHRRLGSLLGVTVHEAFHSWYQGVLGTNESLYPWMDEGFTSYGSAITMQEILNPDSDKNPLAGSLRGYIYNATSGNEEPLNVHSDHYQSNRAYSLNAYSKGAIFLNQLSYIMGHEPFMTGMRRYFNEWKFKHPTPNDFIRIMEKVSGMHLDWYMEHFVNSTNTIDYSIESVEEKNGKTHITLRRESSMIMPMDVYVATNSGQVTVHNIPLKVMYGDKSQENEKLDFKKEKDWEWVNPTYTLIVDKPLSQLSAISIDPTERLADIDRKNNDWMNEKK